jgi:hypothetical protein
MKHSILTILLFGFFFTAFAQDEDPSGNFYLVSSLGFSPYNSDKDIAGFQDGYDEYWKTSLSKTFTRDILAYNASFGAQYWLTKRMGFAYNVRYSTHGYRVEFTDGEKRELIFRVRSPLEFGLLLGNPNRFYMNLSFGYGNSRIISTREYKDGTRSMNFDSPLNGVFSASGFTYRIEACFKLYKGLQFVGAIGGLGGSEYTDKNAIRGIDSRLGPYEIKGFPKEYPDFQSTVTAGSAYDYPMDKWAKVKYFTVSAGLIYRLQLFTWKAKI